MQKSQVTQNSCPFDFINEFDKWFYYHKCKEFEKLTHEQVMIDIKLVFSGWTRVKGRYGGWTHNGIYYTTIEAKCIGPWDGITRYTFVGNPDAILKGKF